ncbi:Nn.00g007400.m01.CDS01 [Neocucurbitaria sp. VM-36]
MSSRRVRKPWAAMSVNSLSTMSISAPGDSLASRLHDRMNRAHEHFVRSRSSQTKKTLNRLRFPFEIFAAMVMCLILVLFVNWVFVTLNFLPPESLEKVMRWRASVSRIVWLVCMIIWARLRAQRPLTLLCSQALACLIHHALSTEVVGQQFCQLAHVPTYYGHAAKPILTWPLRPYPELFLYALLTKEDWRRECQQLDTELYLSYGTLFPSRKRRRLTYDQEMWEDKYATFFRLGHRKVFMGDFQLEPRTQQNEGPLVDSYRSHEAKVSVPKGAASADSTSGPIAVDTSQFVHSNSQRMFIFSGRGIPAQYSGETHTVPSQKPPKKAERDAIKDERDAAEMKARHQAAKAQREAAKEVHRKAEEEEEEAILKAQAQAKAVQRFFARRTIFMARATRPAHPKAVVKCEIETPTNTLFKARGLPSCNPEDNPPWVEQQFEHVFGTDSGNGNVFDRIKPIVVELKNPTGRYVCLGADGFSGCGKSYTMENLLAMIGENLFGVIGNPTEHLQVVFEAFQSSGTDVSSLDVSVKPSGTSGLQRLNQSPVALAPPPMFRQDRPYYIVNTFAAFETLISEIAKFRDKSETHNNTTSSRTHLVIIIYTTLERKTSTLCLFDLAGNERKDALECIPDDAREKEEQTTVINDSRMKIQLALEAAVEGKRLVTRETTVGALLTTLLIDRRALLIMLFHMSIYTSFTGAVSKTLKDASALKKARGRRQKAEAAAALTSTL